MVRVICADLSASDDNLYRYLYENASPERKARADRFRLREDVLRCVAAEALLRYVLGTDQYHLEKTPGGKPFLPDRPDFHFNLSHSGKWAAIAWGSGEVGLDVEQIRQDARIESIARRYFCEEEQQYVFAEEAERHQRFFEIWTGKESYVKYLGTGLGIDLTAFSVLSPEPGLHIHRRTLPDGSWLSLCTAEDDYCVELIDVKNLI